jgi:hypothetical protein
LKDAIAAEEEKATELGSRGAPKAANRHGGGGGGGSPGGAGMRATTGATPVGAVAAGSMIPLEKLSGKVTEVYNRCGFDYDPSISTIQMLTNIESKLEHYLGVVDEMPAVGLVQLHAVDPERSKAPGFKP